MTLEEALQVLHCPRETPAEPRYSTSTMRSTIGSSACGRWQPRGRSGRPWKRRIHFLKNLPGFGPVAVPEPELSPDLQQALRSPYADMCVGAVRTLGYLLHEDADLAPRARQMLEGLVQDASPQVRRRPRKRCGECVRPQTPRASHDRAPGRRGISASGGSCSWRCWVWGWDSRCSSG